MSEFIFFISAALLMTLIGFVGGVSASYSSYKDGKDKYCLQEYSLYKEVENCKNKSYPWEVRE